MNTALLRIAFPDFWFGQLTHRRHRPRWVAICKDDTGAGLYAVATADLNALTAALTLDCAWRSGHSTLPAASVAVGGAAGGNPIIHPTDP